MRILTVGPTGVVAMQRVLHWMAEREEEVWVVDQNDRYPLLAAGRLQVFAVVPAQGAGWRAQQALQRVGLGGLVERRSNGKTSACRRRISA